MYKVKLKEFWLNFFKWKSLVYIFTDTFGFMGKPNNQQNRRFLQRLLFLLDSSIKHWKYKCVEVVKISLLKINFNCLRKTGRK